MKFQNHYPPKYAHRLLLWFLKKELVEQPSEKLVQQALDLLENKGAVTKLKGKGGKILYRARR